MGEGVKWPPVHFCLCISETVRHTAMRFWDTLQDSKGYSSPYKVLSHLYRKCGHDGVKPEVHFRKSAESRMPDCKYHDYKLSYFHWYMVWICCWHGFLMSIFIAICDPKNMCLVLEIYNYLWFRAWPWRHLIVTWRRHVPRDVISHFIELMDT